MSLPDRVSEPSPDYCARLYSENPDELQPELSEERHPITMPAPSSAPELELDIPVPGRELREWMKATDATLASVMVLLQELVPVAKGARQAAADCADAVNRYMDRVSTLGAEVKRLQEHVRGNGAYNGP